jgi:hypothetical protein
MRSLHILITLVAASSPLAFGSQPAMGEAAVVRCNADLIKGAYSTTAQGWSGGLPTASERKSVFDGVSKFTSTGYLSVGGTISNITITATYEVKPDCTLTLVGKLADGGSISEFSVIADNGNRIHAIRTDIFNTLTIDYERVLQ